MKNGLKILGALLCCFLFYTSIWAAPTISIRNLGTNTKSIALYIENPDMMALTISLIDEDDVKLHNDILDEQDSFAKRYNLKNLPAGEYTIVIENNYFIKSQPIHVGGDDVKVMKEEEVTIYKPAIKRNGNFIDFDMLLLGDAKVVLKIVDYKGRSNFVEVIENEEWIQKRFNIGKLEEGDYSLTVSWRQGSTERNISEPFRIG